MEKRDGELVSLATRLGVEGFRQTPFSVETVRRFLSQCGKRVREQEDSARQEKVRVCYNFVRCIICNIAHVCIVWILDRCCSLVLVHLLTSYFLFLFCA